MIWERAGKYSIKSGHWNIAKAFIDGATLYSLHQNMSDAIKFDEDVEALKQLAEQIDNQNEG